MKTIANRKDARRRVSRRISDLKCIFKFDIHVFSSIIRAAK